MAQRHGLYKQWLSFMDKYDPDGDKADNQAVYGYSIGEVTARIREMCGDDLTRENVMQQAVSLRKIRLPMVIPGIMLDSSATDFQLITQAQMRRFNGELRPIQSDSVRRERLTKAGGRDDVATA